MEKVIWKIIIFLGLVVTPSFVFAGVVDVSLSPQAPEPQETVRATLIGPLVDFDKSKIYWYINEKVQVSGIGEKTFSFIVGEVEEKTTLDIIIITEQGRRFDLQKIIVPTSIDLLWEAQTYTPPFYRGKALPTEGSPIKVVAIPNTKDQKTKYTYSWGVNKLFPLVDSSGYNRTSFILSGAKEKYSQKVVVSVSSFDGSKNTKKIIKITSVEPAVILYEKSIKNILNSPFLGQALSGAKEVNSKGLVIRAEPYFFSKTDLENNKLEYIWKINQSSIKNLKKQQREINFVPPTKESAGQQQSSIQVTIKNTATYAQQRSAGLSLKY
ncbi:hypothetical protein KJ973_00330 [Patescibacteria group bacterium]|nr:hypothetical protein [Patescibacteria group bacterium]MBU1519133.1 hypothetical protein [Patescibacteria group bacterium]MBU2416641.1 hypothetical protein [Patescibacteria group bacterium]MBU2461203.1 hypothetical protein [Patescibacteria group bacterium]